MANVKIIAPQVLQPEHLRVAAYCRVSSDSTDQLHSYAAQIRSYTEEIAQHDDWELVDVYADEGLTGTRMDKRSDFNRMIADCRKGKIDRILVKSVSRFARNTRDCLITLRELSTLGVSVQFEKENIDTKTLTTEPKSILSRLTPYFSCTCGQKLTRFGGRWLEKDRLHLKCGACGCTTSADADQAVKEIVRQFYAHGQAGQTCYVPSAEVIRLNNAINRGLEQPDEPEAVAALILQGAAARYQCCPDITRGISGHPSQIDWRYFHRVVSCIIVSPENTVTVKFQDEAATGKE